jgi:hypothetical protein
VAASIKEHLAAVGITNEMLAQRFFEGLNATMVTRETAYAKSEELPDFAERREMLELILRLTGLLTNQHHVRVKTMTYEELLDGSYEEHEK